MMMPNPARTLRLSLPLLLALAPAVHAQTTHAPLQQRMSYAKFRQLGLDKLSSAQLKALNAWLQTHGDTGPTMDGPIRSGPATSNDSRQTGDAREIHSTLEGIFRGWSYGTVFTLANGQRWKVVESEALTMHSIKQPKVTLRKGFLGSWLFSVDGVRESARVTPAH